MRRLVITAFAFAMILARPAQGQWGPARFRVWSCSTADSLAGPVKREPDVLNGIGSPKADSAFVRSAEYLDPRRGGVDIQLAVAGKRADAWLDVTVAGSEARVIMSSQEMPLITIVLDDSTVLDLGYASRGGYRGPATSTLAPLTIALPAASFLRVVQAGKVAARVGQELHRVPDGTLRAFRALYLRKHGVDFHEASHSLRRSPRDHGPRSRAFTPRGADA